MPLHLLGLNMLFCKPGTQKFIFNNYTAILGTFPYYEIDDYRRFYKSISPRLGNTGSQGAIVSAV